MLRSLADYDAVVVGGGFYGCSLAICLGERLERVALVEKHDDLLTRASYANQARVHNGYHYPRSFMTALRSAVNFPRFALDFKECVESGFEKLYAIARQQSKVTAYQFHRFCQSIGVPIRPAAPQVARLFNQDLIEAVFSVTEYAFNAAKLRAVLTDRLQHARVRVMLGFEASQIVEGNHSLRLRRTSGDEISASAIFNCTYSQINQLLTNSGLPPIPLKHEITELSLIEPPPELRSIGVTVMDGPFFSTMPFPALGLHSLSHVRYTPHESWREPETPRDPQDYLARLRPVSKHPFMIKDAARYLPCLERSSHVRSLFEVKTVLAQNETDDGRPILIRPHREIAGVTTIMGGKIDNIYDVIAALSDLKVSARGVRG